jgi:hypothetical protein
MKQVINDLKNIIKMSKNNQKGNKAPKVPQKAPEVKKPEAKKPEVKNSEVEVAEVVTLPKAAEPSNLMSRKNSGLSPDGQVRLLDLAHRVFVEEKDPDLQFPQKVRVTTNKIVAIGIMCSFADHAATGDNSFAMVLQSQAYPMLSSAAEELGIKLPDIKALPAGKESGTVMLESSQVKISPETKKKLKEEDKIRKGEKPEMDPEKLTSAEDVSKALEYMFLSSGGKRLPELLVESIDFMKKFRMHEASLAENAEEAKARFENYNSGDWLNDVFSYFRPPVFFAGIGKGMATVIAGKKNPIHAFIILRDAIKDPQTKEPVLEDQEIAYCVKSIVKWFCDTCIESNTKAIENLDAKKNKAEIEKCKSQIKYYNDIIDCLTTPSADEINTLLDNIGSDFDEGGTLTTECQNANATLNRICKSYYGKQLAVADYKNLDTNIQQYGFHIINLFRSPGERLPDCGLSNITELEERSEEEREAAIKEAKKAWAERKSKQKEEELKNA